MSNEPPQPRVHWNNARLSSHHDASVRVGVVALPIVMIIAGIHGPSAVPAVFGEIWLPFSLWFVVIKPRLPKRQRKTYTRPW
ncbi:hypothetical protein ABH940_005833 [Streptacidiphilus sp. BW17]|uniref:hypothetical protein n=1 Tax=Streptacidiphilus sp. BW17 TaxID=3156274 RepID=UPI0035143854